MLRAIGLFVVACLVSECSARMAVTLLDRDYSYVQPNEILINHIKHVLEQISQLQVTVHPRVRHLYDLLRKEVQLQGRETRFGQRHHELDFSKTLKPKYDVNKLNRIFTTPADR